KLRRTIALGCARAKRRPVASLAPHPGYASTAVQRVKLTSETSCRNSMVSLKVNGLIVEANATPDTPLLWVLRDHFGLTGTKFGCGIGQCGACTVHLDGHP